MLVVGIDTAQLKAGLAALKVQVAGVATALSAADAQAGKIRGMGQNLKQLGSSLSMTVTAPIVLAGVAITKMAFGFEQAMANVASVASSSPEDLKKMSQAARDIGKDSVYGATEAANAMYWMAAAGWKTEQMISALPDILQYAAATQSDLATATDQVISTIYQFGLKASDAGMVADIYAQACADSLATTDKLSYSMKYAGPIASSLSMSLAETTGALEVLYNQGYQGEQAGTILRNMLKALLNPTAGVSDALTKMGLTAAEVNPQFHSFDEILDTLAEHGLDASNAFDIFGARAGPGAMAFLKIGENGLGAGAAVRAFTKNLEKGGSAAAMYKQQMDTVAARFEVMKAKVEELAISMGEALLPMLEKLMNQVLIPLITWFSNLDEGSKSFIIMGLAIAAMIGPLAYVVGSFMSLYGAMKLVKGLKMIDMVNKLTGSVQDMSLYVGKNTTAWTKLGTAAGIMGFMVMAMTSDSNELKAVFSLMVGVMVALAAAQWLYNTSLATWLGLTGVGLVLVAAGVTAAATMYLVSQKYGAKAPATAGAPTWGSGGKGPQSAEPTAAFAKGAMVYKPTIALIGEAGPEAVIPLEVLQSIIATPTVVGSAYTPLPSFNLPSQIAPEAAQLPKMTFPELSSPIASLSIPALATGGYIDGPTLALVGEAGPELVIPLDRMGDVFEGSSSVGGSTNIFNIYEASDARGTANEIVRLVKREGVRL